MIPLLTQLGAQVSPAEPTSHLGVGLPAKGLEILCVGWIDERVCLGNFKALAICGGFVVWQLLAPVDLDD